MMKLTTTLVLLFATFFSSAEGLAFVTGIMRPIVNPVAAMKSMRQRAPAISHAAPATTSLSNAATADSLPDASKPSAVDAFGSDDSTSLLRSEMLDLVYQRSLDRMDSFSQ